MASNLKTHWHLWLVGLLSLIWNMIGVVAWYNQIKRSPAWLADLTVAQVRFIETTPVWASVAFGLAVWAALLGAMALLLRRRLAFNAYVASLVGFIVHVVYVYGLNSGAALFGSEAVIFSGLVLIVTLFEIGYARWMAKQGVLR